MTAPAGGRGRIGVGLGLPQLGPHVTTAALRSFCARAEELGYASLWVQEHLFYPHANSSGYAGRTDTAVNPAYRSIWGPFELMAYAAALTERIVIGSSILVAGYHRPIELAQHLSTLDQLSGGRLVAGLSAGWSDEEHVQMGVDPRSRGRRMEELVAALRACWGPDPVSFEGEFFSIPVSDVNPKPVQQFPPLLSGLRSAAGLRRTAAMFDIWNPSRGTPAELRAQMAEMNGSRGDQGPLALYFRAYAQRPTDELGSGGAGLPGLHDDLALSVEAGAEQIIVDCNFWDGIDSPQAWAEVPDLMVPLLEQANDLANA